MTYTFPAYNKLDKYIISIFWGEKKEKLILTTFANLLGNIFYLKLGPKSNCYAELLHESVIQIC